MKHTRALRLAMALAIVAAAFATSCSSSPKAPPIVLETRNQAAQFVLLGAKALREGQMASAGTFYTEAYRLYTATDDAEGRIRALDGLGRLPEASAADLWRTAVVVATDTGDAKLIALAGLLDAELKLRSADESEVRRALETARGAARILSAEPRDRARALRLAGAAAKALNDYPLALDLLNEAAGIDLKEKAFIEYASDRYVAASVYSKAGDYPAARAALQEALESDRRAEHPAGIGGDYFALALIAEKTGDAPAAARNFERAAEVFRAARLDERAAEAESRRDASAQGAAALGPAAQAAGDAAPTEGEAK